MKASQPRREFFTTDSSRLPLQKRFIVQDSDTLCFLFIAIMIRSIAVARNPRLCAAVVSPTSPSQAALCFHSRSSCSCCRQQSADATKTPPGPGLCSRRFLSISRMLDLGGAPSGFTDRTTICRTVDASKNCRLQAICFDFETLTQSLDHRSAAESPTSSPSSGGGTTTNPSQQPFAAPRLGDVRPDTTKIEQIAGLLKVDLGSSKTSPARARPDDDDADDDLSLLTGETKQPPQTPSWSTDIRAKYAAKLSEKGVSGKKGGAVDSTQQGDASFHLAARHWVASADTPTDTAAGQGGATRWMARTGTGHLLQYATQRSIRLAMVPSHPGSEHPDEAEAQQMQALQRQLPEVVWDALVTDGTENAPNLLEQALVGLEKPPAAATLLVSRRDEYLRAAREAGWMTCRIRPKNAPRGNVSTHFTVESIPDVKQVLDEINGISYAAVLNQGTNRR